MDANIIEDDKMTYDIYHHRYICVADNLAEALSIDPSTFWDAKTIAKICNRASMLVYSYIASWAQDITRTLYEMIQPTYRLALYDAMIETIEALILHRGDIGMEYSADSTITANVKLILEDAGCLYRGKWNYRDPAYISTMGEEW